MAPGARVIQIAMFGQSEEDPMSKAPVSDAPLAWRDCCRRIEALGERIPEEGFPAEPAARADGIAHPADPVSCWLGWGIGIRIPSLNPEQMRVDREGRFRMVLSHRDPDVPKRLDCGGHRRGLLTYHSFWPRGRSGLREPGASRLRGRGRAAGGCSPAQTSPRLALPHRRRTRAS